MLSISKIGLKVSCQCRSMSLPLRSQCHFSFIFAWQIHDNVKSVVNVKSRVGRLMSLSVMTLTCKCHFSTWFPQNDYLVVKNLPIPPPIMAIGLWWGSLNLQHRTVFPGDNSLNNFASKAGIISETPKKQIVDFSRFFTYSQLSLLDSAKITIMLVCSRNMASLTEFQLFYTL